MPRITAEQAGGKNVCAMLDVIAWSELGLTLLAKSDNGYNVLVGSTPSKPILFSSYAAHPNVYNPRLDSTAAGRYQELFRNWLAYKGLLQLPDFGPMSQDRTAIQQMKEAQAMPSILAGHFDAAIALIAHLWASLPGAGYGQHEQEMSALRDVFRAAGGQIVSLDRVVGSVA